MDYCYCFLRRCKDKQWGAEKTGTRTNIYGQSQNPGGDYGQRDEEWPLARFAMKPVDITCKTGSMNFLLPTRLLLPMVVPLGLEYMSFTGRAATVASRDAGAKIRIC